MTRYEQVADLMSKGMTDREVAAHLGVSVPAVRSGKQHARRLGIIPPHTPKSDYDAFADRIRRERFRRGNVREALEPLSPDQRKWLLNEAQDIGCKSLAEFICELIRDAHAIALDAKQMRG